MIKKTGYGKKGELTTAQIMGIVMLVVSFAVILIFLSQLDLQRTTSENMCRSSIALKSQGNLMGALAKATNLNCKTNYVCISGGSECEGIIATQTVTVNPQDRSKIMKAIADEMADCWWMYGQGKAAYAEEELFKTDLVCGVCSKIVFDKKIQQAQSEPISYIEFYKYLADTPKSDSQTYSEYLYNGNNYAVFSAEFEGVRHNTFSKFNYVKNYLFQYDEEYKNSNPPASDRSIKFDSSYYLFTASAKPSFFDTYADKILLVSGIVAGTVGAAIGTTVTGGAAAPVAVSAMASFATKAALIGGATLGSLAYGSLVKSSEGYYGFPVVILESKDTEDISCTEYITFPG